MSGGMLLMQHNDNILAVFGFPLVISREEVDRGHGRAALFQATVGRFHARLCRYRNDSPSTGRGLEQDRACVEETPPLRTSEGMRRSREMSVFLTDLFPFSVG